MSKISPAECLDIIPYFYTGTNAREILRKYCEDLRKTLCRRDLLHANMLEHYMNISEDKDFIFLIQNLMYVFFSKHLHCNYQTQMFGRKKSLVSLENKCNFVLEKKKVPEIHDSLGFRIILFEKSPEELVKDCYNIMDNCIDFFIKQGFTPTERENISGTSNFNPNKHPSVLLPKTSLLSTSNKKFVKDYILKPKDLGYQSLHVIFVDTHGREFEVQIRSYLMDQYAEYGPAAHYFYKNKRYKDDDNNSEKNENMSTSSFQKIDIKKIDFFRINSEQFIVTDDGKIYDKAGIISPRIFFALSNT